jgi:hypothetical protein
MKLSKAIRETGYHVIVTKSPIRVVGGLGTGRAGMQARAFYNPKLGGFGVAIQKDCWTLAYVASHEIAEMRNGFKHSADMFCEQANYLAAWHGLRSGMRPKWLKKSEAV